jgi:hypothetical protein
MHVVVLEHATGNHKTTMQRLLYSFDTDDRPAGALRADTQNFKLTYRTVVSFALHNTTYTRTPRVS